MSTGRPVSNFEFAVEDTDDPASLPFAHPATVRMLRARLAARRESGRSWASSSRRPSSSGWSAAP